MGPAGPWKNRDLIWFYLGVLCWLLDLRVSIWSQFQRNKASIGLKLKVKLQKSNNSANLCCRFIGFTCCSTNLLTLNNFPFVLLEEQSWLRGTENFVFKIVSVFSRFFLSLLEVYQDKTRMFYGIYVILLRQPRCSQKTFTLYSKQDGCDDAELKNLNLYLLLKAFFSLDRPFENGARRNRKYDTFYNKKIP